MKSITTCDAIPLGCFIDEHYINAEGTLQIHDLLDLRYSVLEKLGMAKQIIHRHKKDLINFFSDNDKHLLSTFADDKQFVNEIIENNIIRYNNQPSQKIDNLLISSEFTQGDRKPVSFLSKWMILDKNKLSSLLGNQIYSGFPDSFNDVFDSQIRLDAKSIESLKNAFLQDFKIKSNSTNQAQPVSDQHKDRVIKFFQALFSCYTVCCFSKHDPVNFSSNYMWGQYGGCGKGIALIYSIDSWRNFLFCKSGYYKDVITQSINVNVHSSELTRIKSVHYDNKFSPYVFIEKYLKLKNKTWGVCNKSKEMEDLLAAFNTTKTCCWQQEQEVRLIN